MGKYQKFDEVPVWQEASRLYQKVLDMTEESNLPLSATFRNQLERATLSISGSVAEGFDCSTGEDMLTFLLMARGAAAEVQSMVTIVKDRPKVARLREPLEQIRATAEACARQLNNWRYAIENPGKRQQSFGAGQTTTQASAGSGTPVSAAPPNSANPTGSMPRNRA